MSLYPRALPAGRVVAMVAVNGVVVLLALALLWSLPPSLPPLLERVSMPFQIDPSEGVIVGETRLLLEGTNVWAPVQPGLFTAAPYPPVFYLLLLPAMAVGAPPLAAARWLTLVATIALAGILAVLVTRWTRQPAAGLVAAGLWLTPNLVAVWAVRARPDLIALATNLVGLGFVWWAIHRGQATATTPTSHGRAWLRDLTRPVFAWPAIVAALLFALGFYAKHTALAAPAAAGLYLVWRQPRVATGFGIAYGAAVLGPYVAFDLLTSGGFTQHLVSFHRSWLWQNYVELAVPFLRHYWPLTLLPIVAATADVLTHGRPSLPTLYVVTACLVSLGGGTHGGNHNHLLEVLLALALASGVALGAAMTNRLALPALLLAIVSALALTGEPSADRAWLASDLRPPRPADQLGWQQVLPVVSRDAGPVYSDNVGLLAVTDHDIWVTDPFTMAGSVQAGLWSDAALVDAVRRRQFSLIALRYDVNRLTGVPTDISPDLLAAIREHYAVAERNIMFLYRPKPERAAAATAREWAG